MTGSTVNKLLQTLSYNVITNFLILLCLFNFWKNNPLLSNIKQMVNSLTKVSTILRKAKERSKVRLKKKNCTDDPV